MRPFSLSFKIKIAGANLSFNTQPLTPEGEFSRLSQRYNSIGMCFPKSFFHTDQRAIGKSSESDLQGPTHGGDYNPNDRANIPISQRNNTSVSDSWRTGPAHGGDYDSNDRINIPSSQRNNISSSDSWGTRLAHSGDYDPNQFDANHLPSQGPSQ